jgi:hypothetical protein
VNYQESPTLIEAFQKTSNFIQFYSFFLNMNNYPILFFNVFDFKTNKIYIYNDILSFFKQLKNIPKIVSNLELRKIYSLVFSC